MKTHKFWVVGIFLLFGIYFVTLLPSFNLALTGDDYLGLWRYDFYTNGWGGEKLNNLSFFFSDYGPMDTLTATIHHYFGFNHKVYYIFSFLLRLTASLSFLWPVYKLTRNKWASLGSAAFFSITVTGLETTDWSFNMPSYAAIAVMNTLLGVFTITRSKNNLWIWTILALLFVIAIISQPIRMLFLPALMIGLEIYWLITNFNWKKTVLTVFRIGLYILLTTSILKYTSIGGAVGARGTAALIKNYGLVIKHYQEKNYKIFLSPISQLGKIILPNDFMYQRLEHWGLPRTFRRAVIPVFAGFAIWLVFFKSKRIELVSGLLVGGGWTAYVWQEFIAKTSSPVEPFELFTYLIGGYFLIWVILWWIQLKGQNNLRLILVLSVFMMIGGFIAPWLRNPGFLYEITGRYLIVSGAGLAWLMAVPLATKTDLKRKLVLIMMFGLLFSLHAKTSYRYLYHLSEVRGIELTDRLRGSIKRAKNFGNPKEPLVFYFEGDDPEILQHAFIFGFPVIASFQFDFAPWYNIAATNIWLEVESAYLDGQSLKRFMPGPYFPVKLENIYVYRLQSRNLIDVTDEKRELLRKLKNVKN
ncbi:MAG: hypothetical protein AAB887_00485 [Patescibacteria group bacterium]